MRQAAYGSIALAERVHRSSPAVFAANIFQNLKNLFWHRSLYTQKQSWLKFDNFRPQESFICFSEKQWIKIEIQANSLCSLGAGQKKLVTSWGFLNMIGWPIEAGDMIVGGTCWGVVCMTLGKVFARCIAAATAAICCCCCCCWIILLYWDLTPAPFIPAEPFPIIRPADGIEPVDELPPDGYLTEQKLFTAFVNSCKVWDVHVHVCSSLFCLSISLLRFYYGWHRHEDESSGPS